MFLLVCHGVEKKLRLLILALLLGIGAKHNGICDDFNAYILCYLLVLILIRMAIGEVSPDAANTLSLPGVSRDFVPPES